ncbi:unnamed protein product [Paramecium octaurelia]|uniref:Ankyrin repeat protein n=1 Tax=Paramecium octaurelia TaxID=43137 RepID=A0A8S1X4P9_PAROT|nr:unnamed protein product [Paramecium octaurelia]
MEYSDSNRSGQAGIQPCKYFDIELSKNANLTVQQVESECQINLMNQNSLISIKLLNSILRKPTKRINNYNCNMKGIMNHTTLIQLQFQHLHRKINSKQLEICFWEYGDCNRMLLNQQNLQQNRTKQNQEQFYDNFGSTQRHFNSNYKQIHPAKDSQDLRLMDIFNQFKLVCLFTQHSMSGSSEDIQNMIKILQRDPKRNLTNPQDPTHIINQLNQYGQNALYIASKNGNVEVIKFLLSLECNPHIRSRIVEDLTESPLEVSSRWHHLECVRLLLNAGKYTNAELRSAIKVTENQEIINLLKLNMTSSLFSCCL